MMRAMTLPAPGQLLVMTELPMPQPQANDVVLQVLACGVCRTDLHIVDGDLPPRHPSIVPGHEVVPWRKPMRQLPRCALGALMARRYWCLESAAKVRFIKAFQRLNGRLNATTCMEGTS